MTVALLLSAPATAQEAAAPAASEGMFTVTLDEAQEALAASIAKESKAENVTASITSARTGVLYRSDKPLSTEVKTLKINEHDSRFTANLYFVNDNGEVMSVAPVSGRYEEMVMVPTARQRLNSGDVIGEGDLEAVAFPISKLRKDTVVDAAEIIGKTPQRIISGGRPIRADELQSPRLLQKGANVQMSYKTPYMTISTAGEALEAGAKGDTIKVKNIESNKIVEARIQSADEVIVGSVPLRVE